MHARRLAIGLLALAALAFVAGTATAGDTIRLSLPGGESAPTLNLKATPDDLTADNLAARFGRGFVGGYRGGFVGGYRGGFVGGYRGGFVGGYRGGFVGGYRGFVGGYGGGFRGYYAPRYFGPSFNRPFFAYTPSYYYYYPTYSGYTYSSNDYCSPIADAGIVVQPRTTVLRPAAANYDLAPPMSQADQQPRLAPSPSGTFPYDGGPQRSIPMPPADESPVGYPRLSKPALVEDLVVKLPGKASSGKWTYPAYGETPSR